MRILATWSPLTPTDRGRVCPLKRMNKKESRPLTAMDLQRIMFFFKMDFAALCPEDEELMIM